MTENPLGYEKTSTLIRKFALPAIISMLAAAFYNVIDQIFIGQGVGLLGNAATNVAFPTVTISIALALLVCVGGASYYNIKQGEGDREESLKTMGSSITLVIIFGVILAAVILVFLKPLIFLLGSTQDVYPYAAAYTMITAIGIPANMMGVGLTLFIRADGSPRASMIISLSGIIINTILDPVFIFVFKWGIRGAAWATVIGQYVAAILIIYYFVKKANARLRRSDFMPAGKRTLTIMSIGLGGAVFNIALMISQILLNNAVHKYGLTSVYGADIPLACVGIVTKVNQIFIAVCIGLHEGCQPILGYNFGAKHYDRVKKTFLQAGLICVIVGLIFTAAFELFPAQIMSIFGGGSAEYFECGSRFFRIFMMFTVFYGLGMYVSGCFTAVGKYSYAFLLPLIRQIFTFVPLVLLLPLAFGLDGVLLAGPIADAIAMIFCVVFLVKYNRQYFQEINGIITNRKR